MCGDSFPPKSMVYRLAVRSESDRSFFKGSLASAANTYGDEEALIGW